MKLFLIEAKSREEMLHILANKYQYDEDFIQQILDIDPTKKCSYTQWFLKAMDNTNYPQMLVQDAQKLFKFAQENHDFQLQNFDSVDDAFEAIEEFKGKSEYEIVFEDETWVVYTTHSYEAERYVVWHIHQGAVWCTAADSDSGRSYFESYNQGGQLYIFFNKQNEWNGYTSEALFQYATKNDEFRDSENENIDIEAWNEIGGNNESLIVWFKETTGKDLGDALTNNVREEWFEEAEEVTDSKGNFLCYIYEHELYYDYNEQIPNTGTYYELDGNGHGYITYEDYLIIFEDTRYVDRVAVLFKNRWEDGSGQPNNDAQLKVVLDNADVVLYESSYYFWLLSVWADRREKYYIIDADCDNPRPPYLLKNILDLEVIGDNYDSMFREVTANFQGKPHLALFHPWSWDGEDPDNYILAYDVEDIELEGAYAYFTKYDEEGKPHRYKTDSSGEEMKEIDYDFDDEDEDDEYDDVDESIKSFWSLTNRLDEIHRRNRNILFN